MVFLCILVPMNIRTVFTLVITIIVFGLPIWNLARLRGSRHILWAISPVVIFLSLFQGSRLLESLGDEFWYTLTKTTSYYLLIISLVLFGMSIIITLFATAFRIHNKKTFWLILGVTMVFSLGARLQGERIIIKDLTLPADHITREYNFVHITDLHSGSTDVRHAARVVEKIKSVNPEFTVITGDFIDEFYTSTEDILPFNEIETPIYLITGNHEYYLDPNKINEVIEGTHIELIDDMRVAFDELDIIGVNELATVDNTLDVLGGISPNRYTILLDHQPLEDEAQRASEQGTHLMLSGHTHNGQMWPMGLLLKMRYKYIAGLYEIGGMFLYVNQGTGTLGPKMRFGTANEVTNITLVPKDLEE